MKWIRKAAFLLSTTSSNLLKTTGETLVRRRRGVVGYGDSEIVFEAGEFEVAGNAVKLFDYADTLLIGQSGKWEEMFRTEPVWVSDEDVLSYFQGFETLNPDELTQTLPGNAKIRFLLEVYPKPHSRGFTGAKRICAECQYPHGSIFPGAGEAQGRSFHQPVNGRSALRNRR